MKISIRNLTIEITCLLYILLLVYAAMNKGLDFENFRVELGQSPLLSAFAGWISWIVLIVEFSIAGALLFPKTRMKALYAGFCLMSMFTAYIFIMLNYSSFLPCSCGGILEEMTWQEHLVFNLFFVILGGLALWLHHRKKYTKRKFKDILSYPAQLCVSILASAAAVGILFLGSEEIMHHQNPFIRRYPHHPVTLKQTIDLKYNSYYFAGEGQGKLYLGNYTVPLYLLVIDSRWQQEKIRVAFDQDRFSFKSLRMNVQPPFFYIIDGRVPVIFRGQITSWKAKIQTPAPPYFNVGIPLDSTTVAFRAISRKSNQNSLGIFTWAAPSETVLRPHLLQKQIDGVFDTDGMLHYSEELQRMVYVYNYRNQYIVADKSGSLDYRGNTIDTVSHANIKVAYLDKKKERTMSKPALTVNSSSCVYGHLLFVNSQVPGRYEQQKVWQQASVIDVYDLRKRAYLFSFPVYGIKGKKVRNFLVSPTHLYALIDTDLVIYELNDKLKKEIRAVQKKSF